MRHLLLAIVLVSSPSLAQGIEIEPPIAGQGGTSGAAHPAPDVGGAAGSSQLVDVVSGFVTVRDAGTGHPLASSTADAFWQAAGVTGAPAAFAQHAIFDPQSQRWYLSAEQATTGTPNLIYVAVSASWDALGPWKAVMLPAQGAVIANTHLAQDLAGLYITGDTSGHSIVFALPLADLLWTGAAAPSASHLNVLTAPLAGLVPAVAPDPVSSDRRFFIARDVLASGNTSVDVYTLSWAGPSATFAAPVSIDLGTAYSLPSRAAVQPAPAPGLAAGTGAIANATSTDGLIAGIATTEVAGKLAALWFEVYVDPSTPGIQWYVHSGTIVDPAADLIVPAIAMSSDATLGVVLARTSATEPPAIYVTGRTSDDPAGSMRGLVLARAGDATYACSPTGGVSAFGRYSSIASTATGFWAVAQFGASATDCVFGTEWINFSVPPNLDAYDIGEGGDDPAWGEHHPRAPLFGCGGCGTRDGSGAIVMLAIVALGFARRRRPRAR